MLVSRLVSFRSVLLRLALALFLFSGLYACVTFDGADSQSVFQQGLIKADKALAKQDFVTASSIMKTLAGQRHQATPVELAHADIVSLELSLHQHNLVEANGLIQWLDTTSINLLAVPLQQRYYTGKIRLAEKLNKPLAAMDLRIKHAGLLYPDKSTAHSMILSALFRLSIHDLERGVSASTADSVEQGWYALALGLSENLWDLVLQKQSVRIWLDKWRRHPASFVLPDYVTKLLKQKPEPMHIVLALPFSGDLAHISQAIASGLALVYQAYPQTYLQRFRLTRIDTTLKNATEILAEARTLSADFVIGPLVKAKVEQLETLLATEQRKSSSVKFLALNFSDRNKDKKNDNKKDEGENENKGKSEKQAVAGFFQFGFNLIDEIDYLSDQAYAAGYKKIAILAEASDWGKRADNLLIDKWLDLGGTVIDSYDFNLDFADDFVNKVTAVSLSMKFSQSDALFFFGKPDQARQLRPFLSFNKLADLTVFATSHVYANHAMPILNKDLAGIYFSQTPWVMKQRPNLNNRVLVKDGAKARLLGRFYALGVDSMIIVQHLHQLAANHLATKHNFTLPGLTGNLSMSADQVIKRKPLLVRMHGNKPVLVNQIVPPAPAILEDPASETTK